LYFHLQIGPISGWDIKVAVWSIDTGTILNIERPLPDRIRRHRFQRRIDNQIRFVEDVSRGLIGSSLCPTRLRIVDAVTYISELMGRSKITSRSFARGLQEESYLIHTIFICLNYRAS